MSAPRAVFLTAALTSIVFIERTCPSRAAKPPLFHGIQRTNANKSEQQSGPTLGDLDAMNEMSSTINRLIDPSGGRPLDQQHTNQDDGNAVEGQDVPKQRGRSLSRIHLDLSGRIMCHLFSPNRCIEESTTPLICLENNDANSRENRATKSIRRFIPRIYIGANYDLDEIWYGATRWIAKCSWGPSVQDNRRIQTYSALQHQLSRRARNLMNTIFPTNSFDSLTNWAIELESERSVFDSADTTVRVSLVQPRASSPSITTSSPTPQKLTIEHDSAIYSEDYYAPNNSGRGIQYAPTLKFNIQTPILHPRLELHSKQTWIVKEGGDNIGNYYNGAYFGSETPAERRMEQVKAMFRERQPHSHPVLVPQDDDNSKTSSLRAFRGKISSWLENDGWMPQKVTTNLLGNLVSVNEIGLRSHSNQQANDVSELPRNNIGLRLRISRKIDWSKLGVFPWSNSNNSNHLRERRQSVKQATRVQVELCGLNSVADRIAWVTIEADPLDAMNTFKVVVGQESVHF